MPLRRGERRGHHHGAAVHDRGGVRVVVLERVDQRAVEERSRRRRQPACEAERNRLVARAERAHRGMKVLASGKRRRGEADADRVDDMVDRAASHLFRKRPILKHEIGNAPAQRHARPSRISCAAARAASQPKPIALRRPLPER
jgi:hypothetical protein